MYAYYITITYTNGNKEKLISHREFISIREALEKANLSIKTIVKDKTIKELEIRIRL